MEKIFYMRMALILSIIGITSCSTLPEQAISQPVPTHTLSANSTKLNIDEKSAETMPLEGDSVTIWNQLQQFPLSNLRMKLAKATTPTDSAWLKLAIISKQYSTNTTNLLNQLIQWREENPSHPGNILFPNNEKLNTLVTSKTKKHIALLLPLQGRLGPQGQAVRDGYLNAYYDSLDKENQEQIISFFDTSSINLKTLYKQAIAQGADMIIGPLSKEQVQLLSQKTHHSITTLALNYTDQEPKDPRLFQFGLSQNDEVEQLTEKAFQSGKTNAIIIASKEPWSQKIANNLITHWESLGGKIIDSYYYSPRHHLSQDIANLMHINPTEDRAQMNDDNTKDVLQKQRRQDFDILFLIALPQQGREIVPLLKYYYADNIPIYSTSLIYSGSPSPQKDTDLNGVIFCDIPWVLNHPSKSQHNRLYAVGRDAELLSNELERLALLPHFPIHAATGTLSLNSKQQIYRKVAWTKMHAGHP